jgi:large repetitive protein
MKRILFIAILLSSITGFSQAITVNTTQTPGQLVNNVLVDNSCLVQIINIVTSTGSNFGSSNGIGSYQNTNSSFPVTSSGLLLTTGQASLSPGPNTSILSNGGSSATWVGNPELEAALAAAGINVQSKNATLFQFDFIPNSTTFGLDFLFASEEYGAFQCTSNDAFVVILDNLDDPTAPVNVALVPSTADPVTVSNIRNVQFLSACPSQNETYFGVFNGGSNAAGAAINYNGQTKLMHISGTLVANAHYRIKFIIADDGREDGTDGNYDSAVFIPAGSLNLGHQVFPQDLTLANGNALCNGQEYALDTNLDPAIYDFEWKKDTDVLAETGPLLTIDEPGTYSVTISRPGIGCVTTQSIVIEYRPDIPAQQPNNLYRCENGTGTYIYDLSQNTPVLKQGLNPNTVVTYHSSQNNADNNIALPESYPSGSGVTIWARVQNPDNGCYTLRSFQLLTSPPPSANQPNDMVLCETAQGSNSALFNLNLQDTVILGLQPIDENTVSYFTSLVAANLGTPPIDTPSSFTGTNQTIYARVEKTFDSQCFSVTSFDLVVTPLPVLPAASTVNACDSYTLPVLTTGAYYTGNGGTGNVIAAGTILTASQILYIYAQSGGTPNCANQATLTVNIVSSGTAPDDVTACESYELPPLGPGEEYHGAPNGGAPAIPAGTVITATQTIYFFIPAAATCTQNNNFVVTITDTPVVTEIADVTQCDPYILPTLPNGQNYFTQPDGNGVQLSNEGTIATSQTLYIYTTNATNPDCTAQSDFVVTINGVQIPDVQDITRCGVYVLPALPAGSNYYSQPGGVGLIAAGTSITATQTIYVYYQNGTCSDEDIFVVTINPLPILPVIPAVTSCGNYTLPDTLPSYAHYYTQPNGGGTMMPAGTVLTTTQTVYVYANPNEFGCGRSRSFTVTIIDIEAVTPPDQHVCASYTLPPLALGNYYSQSGGVGPQLAPGTVLTASQTVYIYYVSSTAPICTSESNFLVTIKPRPNVVVIADVVACDSYILPALPVGDYFTGPNGGGTMIPAGTPITNTQNIYAFAQTGGTPNCSRQRTFTVTIIPNGSSSPANVISCGPYTLPALPVGDYYNAANGGGGQIPVGTIINTSQTIFTFATVTSGTNCTTDDSFTITINPLLTADDPADVISCVPYELPPLTDGNYFTGPGGNGPIPVGTIITDTQTLYVYNSVPNTANCTAENSFTVTIEEVDVDDLPDVLVCDGFVLPQIPTGNYYTGPGGTGTPLNAGDLINSDQTIYIYAETTTTPPCTDEENFIVTIKPTPVIDNPGNAGSCGPYVLPALTSGNYFTQPGGGGNMYTAGQVITTTTQLYIYADTGGTPNCSSENPFLVVINPAAPEDVSVCGQYILPAPEVGNYFTQPAGQGTPMFEGDIITTTMDVYVYVDLGPGVNCTDNNKFTVTVTPYPVLAPVADIFVCDNYELPAIAVGDYYTGPGGTGNMFAAGDFITETQTIYVYAANDNGTPEPCVDESSFLATIYHTPLVDARSDVLACESYELDELTVGQYFASPGGVDPLPVGFVVEDTMTIYIYGESGTSPNCPGENSFLVEIFNVDPDDPADVEVCDSYTLPVLTEGAYYANTGGPVVDDPTANPEIPAGTVLTAPFDADLYVYSQTGGTRINCNSENAFHVKINETPVVDDTQADVAQCTPFVLPALTVGTYYNAPGGTGGTIAAGTLISTPKTIYIYAATGTGNMCSDEHSYFVDVNIVTVPERPDVTACGEYILPALPVSDGNYFTATNGGGQMLNPGDIINTPGNNTIYIYKQAGTTVICSDESDFVVNIIEAPVPLPTDPLIECGIDDFGHAIFDLVPAMEQMLGAQPNAVISVHETLADAQFDNDPIPDDGVTLPDNTSAYHNVTAYNQTLYCRLESTLTDCYTIGQIQLIVNPRPIATEPEPYEMCDNGADDTDGSAIFDLTTVEAEILGALDPTLFTVTFYNDVEGDIPAPASYNSDSDIIFGKVTNNATGCSDIVELELIVNPLPVANDPTPYTLCDINDPGNEIEVFDLNTKIDEIIGLQDGINVTFFKDFDEAMAGTGPGQILNPEAYTNASTVESIFVRVTLEETGCFRIVLLDVRVAPVPVLVMPTADELTVCDTTGLGFGVFDLEALVEDMLSGATDLEVTFHITWQDAMDGNNPIAGDLSEYHNVDANTQFLYIRVVNTTTGCTTLEPYQITLNVENAPQAPEDLEDLVQCDDQDANGQDNKAVFDLTVQDAAIHAALDPAIITIDYFISEDNANNGAPRIINPAQYNGTNGQTIWVRVETPDNECFSLTSFQLELNQPLLLTTPTVLALCNEALSPPPANPNDGITEFDLTVKDEEILGPFGIGQGNIVTYFEEDPLVDPAATPIPDPTQYVNAGPPLANPVTLFVMVTTPDGCKSYTTLTIKVLPLPVPDITPEPLVQCDVNASPDGMEIFDLTDADGDIRNGDATMVLTYYESFDDANQRINQIANINNYNSASRTIWVRAEANTGNAADPVCYQIVSFELIVNLLPELGEAGIIEPYAICEQNTDGIATFDFNTHMGEILGDDADPADYTVTFHRTEADRIAGIAMPYIYTNTSSPNVQNIVVQAINDETGCINWGPLTLLVEEAAIANPVTETFFECDYDGTNDGVFTFDLTRADDDALGTQNPANYSVTYYISLEDAQAGENAIADPTAYNNTPDYQMIWVRVTNESTVSGCNDITTLELFVERLPEPVLNPDHTTVCIDFVTNGSVRDAIIDSGLDATHTFVWFKDGAEIVGQTGPTLTVSEPGSYTVIATSATGCVSDPIAPVTIEMSGPASPIGTGYVVGNPFGENQVITVLVQGYGEYQYSLDNGPWQNSNVFENVSAYPVSEDYPGHIVHVRDIATADPCDDLDLILDLDGVSPIDYPKFFTPNGDGYHDYWQPFGLWNQSAEVYIFDRYGKLLKQISSSAESLGWDGTYNGQPMPGDDYWFTIEYMVGTETREFKAHFALKR